MKKAAKNRSCLIEPGKGTTDLVAESNVCVHVWCCFRNRRNLDGKFSIVRMRLDWTREATRSDAKQPKFDVIDSSRKVATARNLREQLRNHTCLQAVVR